MDQEARMSQLYDKMAAEQAKYRGWLLEQPPEEIVNYAYRHRKSQQTQDRRQNTPRLIRKRLNLSQGAGFTSRMR